MSLGEGCTGTCTPLTWCPNGTRMTPASGISDSIVKTPHDHLWYRPTSYITTFQMGEGVFLSGYRELSRIE
ncbi:hypothetical protein ACFLV7_15020 [Chloroflexota bacterium]